jgi:hypothetical protein
MTHHHSAGRVGAVTDGRTILFGGFRLLGVLEKGNVNSKMFLCSHFVYLGAIGVAIVALNRYI